MSRHLDGTGSGHPDHWFPRPARRRSRRHLGGPGVEAKLLAKQEARARKKTEFRMWNDGEGLPFCHVHHTNPWAQGGETNTRDAVLLCPFHHHQAHSDNLAYPLRT